MYDFYVLEGKKLIDYKPTKLHYARAIFKNIKENEKIYDLPMNKLLEQYPLKFKQYLYLSIKFITNIFDFEKKYSEQEIIEYFSLIYFIEEMIGCLTPKEFMQMFPITKWYDGDKYQTKDYFFTKESLEEHGMDTLIGEKASKILLDYCNKDIDDYAVAWMGIVNRMYQVNGGRDIALDFFEEQGMPLQTFHKKGNYLVDDETGETFKIAQSKKKLRKLFSVVS